MSPRRRCRGAGPPWWPADQPWPPAEASGGWHRIRRRFLVRAILFLVAVVVIVVGVGSLVAAFVARLLGAPGAPGPPVIRPLPVVVAVLAVMAAVGAARAYRRMSASIGDLLPALGRVSDGAYNTRVPERGAPEVRTLARAFNAMADRLERQDRQRRALLTDISHELRTPLSVLMGQVEGMIDGVYPADAAHLGIALEEAQVLARLVEDLRTLTLAESMELRLVRAPTAIDAVARDAASAFAVQAAGRGVRLDVEAAPHLPPVDVDPERIRQVLANLLSNALRYTPAGGTVRVRCERSVPSECSERSEPDARGGGVVVSVEDTGPGIAAEELPRIFDRFYKSSDSRGSGLGLAIAKGLVEAHGGEISASSVPGGGTTIRFTVGGAAP